MGNDNIEIIKLRMDEIHCSYLKTAYPDIKTKLEDKINKEKCGDDYPWDELERSLRTHGMLTPLDIDITEDNKYIIRDGRHRYLVWSYIHDYKNPYVNLRLRRLIKPKDLINPTKTLRAQKENIKRLTDKRQKELKNKTYGPDTNR
jgi:hypothetical protein